MNEIKVRCWYGNEFVYDPYAFGYDDAGCFFCEDQTAEWSYCNDIQRYLGLYDESGDYIYAGDILEYEDSGKRFVAYDDIHFLRSNMFISNGRILGVSVVGNIYEGLTNK